MIELIARFNDVGDFLGGHIRDKEGVPTVIHPTQLPGVINTCNLVAMSRVAELERERDAIKADFDALRASATKAAEDARAVIANKNVSAEDTCAIIDASAAELLKNKAERDLAAADKVIADAIAARDKLTLK